MNRKIKSTLGLVALLIFILLAGGTYLIIVQGGEIKEKREKLSELKANDYNTENLMAQYEELQLREAVLDSVLAARKFNIPQNVSSIKFFNFLNTVAYQFREDTKLDVELMELKQDRDFFYFEYKVSGGGHFNDVYKLIYAFEQSKELKKIKSISLNNLITTDKTGMPNFFISFNIFVDIYFADNNRFATALLVENNLVPGPIYDIFFPVIRSDIPPNIDELLDVQGARLLALIPEGAFLSDTRGNTYLLWEGEPVYLGYLTNIDYENNKVSFILNKGGIIEKLDIYLEKENKRETKRETIR